MAQRLLGSNAIMDSLNSLVPSSEEPTLPASFLADQLRQKPWRTKPGYTVVVGFNDRIDFTRDGAKVATITPGTYATGAAYTVAVQAAFNAADPTHTFWVCDYNISLPYRVRIYDSTGAPHVLNWATGPNRDRGAGIDLGFIVTIDSTNVNYHMGESVTHQSRHFVTIHRSPSADIPTISANAAVLLEHTATITATGAAVPSPESQVTLQGNTTDEWGASAIAFEQRFVNLPADPCVQYLDVQASGPDPPEPPGLQSFEYFRLLIDDVQNPIGYFELGILYLGMHVEPACKVQAPSLANDPEDFSAVETGIDGTHFVDEHRYRDRWTLDFGAVKPSDQVVLREFFGALHVGENFFFDLDPSDTAIKYGFLTARPREKYISTLLMTVSVGFAEAL